MFWLERGCFGVKTKALATETERSLISQKYLGCTSFANCTCISTPKIIFMKIDLNQIVIVIERKLKKDTLYSFVNNHRTR